MKKSKSCFFLSSVCLRHFNFRKERKINTNTLLARLTWMIRVAILFSFSLTYLLHIYTNCMRDFMKFIFSEYYRNIQLLPMISNSDMIETTQQKNRIKDNNVIVTVLQQNKVHSVVVFGKDAIYCAFILELSNSTKRLSRFRILLPFQHSLVYY
jgi:hypothetical protein